MRGRLTALPVEKSRNATRIASMQSFIGNRRFTSSSVIMMVIAHLFRDVLLALQNRVRFRGTAVVFFALSLPYRVRATGPNGGVAD
jgi:hypothetical protein